MYHERPAVPSSRRTLSRYSRYGGGPEPPREGPEIAPRRRRRLANLFLSSRLREVQPAQDVVEQFLAARAAAAPRALALPARRRRPRDAAESVIVERAETLRLCDPPEGAL